MSLLQFTPAVAGRLPVLLTFVFLSHGVAAQNPVTGHAPRQVMIGEILPEGVDVQWSEVEGTVTAVSSRNGKLELELSAGTGRINVSLDRNPELPAALWMHSQVRATGVCHGTYTVDGHWVAGALSVPDESQLRLLNVAPTLWSDYPLTAIARLSESNDPLMHKNRLVHVRGVVRESRTDGTLLLEDESGRLAVVTPLPSASAVGSEIEVLGIVHPATGGSVLRNAFFRPTPRDRSGEAEILPLLTTAEQIHQLNPRELRRGYPVKLRGVVTRVILENHALILQDFTRGIYVDHLTSSIRPQVGDYWEIEGTTDPGEYSPFVHASADRRRGLGYLPDPVRPSWDQMLNGSMHCQYVELEGLVTATEKNLLTLFTRAGRIRISLDASPANALQHYENATVRIRGSLFNRWDTQTGLIRMGELFLGAWTVYVDQAPPADLFAAPAKRVSELLLFDPHAGPFQRVKVSGQVIHAADGTICLMDRGSGLRFSLSQPTTLAPGDLVEVVGFPEWSWPSPMLREAVMRKTGRASLPAPQKLLPGTMLREDLDSTLVTVEAELLRTGTEPSGDILEMQTGLQRFIARLPSGASSAAALPPGSRLALTGVYLGLGGNRAVNHHIDAFELRLNSAEALHVIARPSWWTLTRMLTVIGFLLGVLLLALIWIGQLRRQVEERAALLEKEIGERQRLEQERTLEQERSRVARDLHDELGSGLTEVGMLGSLARTPGLPAEKKAHYLTQLTDMAHLLVTSLDEIVWAVNPRYDSISSIAGYFSLYAQRFLELAAVRCRLEIARDLPEHLMNSKQRHELFLVLKETLNNVVRHARATEVRLSIAVADRHLVLAVADNGVGLETVGPIPGQDGLANIRDRIKALGGHCLVQSHSGAGTDVQFLIPLP